MCRANRVSSEAQMGELSAGWQAVEAAVVAPGTQHILDLLQDPSRRPPNPRAAVPNHIAELLQRGHTTNIWSPCWRRKWPEQIGGAGGRWSEEAVDVFRQLAFTKAQEVPPAMKWPVVLAWWRRWTRMLAREPQRRTTPTRLSASKRKRNPQQVAGEPLTGRLEAKLEASGKERKKTTARCWRAPNRGRLMSDYTVTEIVHTLARQMRCARQ